MIHMEEHIGSLSDDALGNYALQVDFDELEPEQVRLAMVREDGGDRQALSCFVDRWTLDRVIDMLVKGMGHMDAWERDRP